MEVQIGSSKWWARLRTVAARMSYRTGAWLISKGVQIDPDGGAAVISVVHGSKAWARSWHLGWSSQARKAAALSRLEARALHRHALTLDEIGEMTQ
jgi:hypothetical protein